MAAPDVDPESIRRHTEKLLLSEQLCKSETSRKLLTYLVERSLRNDAPKESEIAFDVFGKGASFSGAEDSVVRVGARTLRQKLAEYYAGPGQHDELRLVIPKGGYRLTVVPPSSASAPGPAPGPMSASVPLSAAGPTPAAVQLADSGTPTALIGAPPPHPRRHFPRSVAWILVALLAVSLTLNMHLLRTRPGAIDDPATSQVRASPIWADMLSSHRPLTIVLGDLFFFTQLDATTSRTLTVRDPQINSSEQLRSFLAAHPDLLLERGQRYASLIQKSEVESMLAVLRIADTPGRAVQVIAGDDLQMDQIRTHDVIYLGPIASLGQLAGYYQLRSRYHYDQARSSLTDMESNKLLLPVGALGGPRVDYALAAKFLGPSGNHIMILTSGMRNAGMLQVVRMATSPEGIAKLGAKLRGSSAKPDSFEALLTVTGFKQTDLAADVVAVHALPARSPATPAAMPATGPASR